MRGPLISLIAVFFAAISVRAGEIEPPCPRKNIFDPYESSFRVRGGMHDGQCIDISSFRNVQILRSENLPSSQLSALSGMSNALIVNNILTDLTMKTHYLGLLPLKGFDLAYVVERDPKDPNFSFPFFKVTFNDLNEPTFFLQDTRDPNKKVHFRSIALLLSTLTFDQEGKGRAVAPPLTSGARPVAMSVLRYDVFESRKTEKEGHQFYAYKLNATDSEKECVLRTFLTKADNLSHQNLFLSDDDLAAEPVHLLESCRSERKTVANAKNPKNPKEKGDIAAAVPLVGLGYLSAAELATPQVIPLKRGERELDRAPASSPSVDDESLTPRGAPNTVSP